MKTCKKCGEEKELEDFHRSKLYPDGRRWHCKLCRKAAEAKRYTKTRESHAKSYTAWRKRNPGRLRGLGALSRYKAQTPSWADREGLLAVYADAPTGMDVDHIIPLNGETVSGLHVVANLQYLTPTENKSKGNTWQYTN